MERKKRNENNEGENKKVERYIYCSRFLSFSLFCFVLFCFVLFFLYFSFLVVIVFVEYRLSTPSAKNINIPDATNI